MAKAPKGNTQYVYRMDHASPQLGLGPADREVLVVDKALAILEQAGILASSRYDPSEMLAFRWGVEHLFDAPGEGVNPRMQRLLYAIGAIHHARNIVVAGARWGCRLLCVAGAVIGAGGSYKADRIIAIEEDPSCVDWARRNVHRIDAHEAVEVLCMPPREWLARNRDPIDLLYIDLDAGNPVTDPYRMAVIVDAYDRLTDGALVLGHCREQSIEKLGDYLSYVRHKNLFSASVHIVFGEEGLEVSKR